MTDVFEEVEEQLRSDRYKSLALKALPWLAGLLVLGLLAFGGYWAWNDYQQKAASKASEQYAEAMKAFDQGRPQEAVKLWTEISQSPSKAYRAMSLMQLGGVKVTDNKPAEAVKFFDEAAKAAPSPVIGDLASLKSAFALLDTAPYKDLEARLTPLTEEGRPYRGPAREALAYAKLMAGDFDGARSAFKVLTLLPDSAQGLRARAQAAIELIDSGSAKAVPAAVKAAAALPPPVQIPQPAPQPQATGPQ